MLFDVVALATVLSALSATSVNPAHTLLGLHPIEAEVICATNVERAKHGLHPLVIDPRLIASARAHAFWMARRRTFVHTQAAVGENIAMGQPSTRQAIRDWMNSPGHRANMLSSAYRRMGAAAYATSDGTIYWCQQFLE